MAHVKGHYLAYVMVHLAFLFTAASAPAEVQKPEGLLNASGLQHAVELAPDDQKSAMRQLLAGMPERDQQTLKADYLLRNVSLAFEAKAKAPWGSKIPEEIFINYVLPYSAIGEDVDDWRADFRSRFLPVIDGMQKPAEAAHKINTVLWKMLDVVYSPKRDKPDQSPYHSMRIKMASCTGLSILLIDACRAVGIPARLVGCLWANKPGNHAWVEVWQDGVWYHLGAFDGAGLNNAWFNSDVIYNKPNDPRYSIFAYAWLPSEGSTTKSVTSGCNTPRPVIDVTQRYLDLCLKTQECRILVVVRDVAGKRKVRDVCLMQDNKPIAFGKTYDDSQDLNSHFSFVAPEGTVAQIQTRQTNGSIIEVRGVTFGKGLPQLCVFVEK
jgi:hypothetical protein